MRGKVTFRNVNRIRTRITPAYAGKRELNVTPNRLLGDHPRLCGEKHREGILAHNSKGITPAYAGKRRTLDEVQDCDRDHPRLCGEKPRSPAAKGTIRGSPPPMRGKVHAFACFFPLCRITPAYAGKRFKIT